LPSPLPNESELAVASQQKRYGSYGQSDDVSTKSDVASRTGPVRFVVNEVAPSAHHRLPSTIVQHLLVVASTRSGV
jgi:hypothetical protein